MPIEAPWGTLTPSTFAKWTSWSTARFVSVRGSIAPDDICTGFPEPLLFYVDVRFSAICDAIASLVVY